ncbi:MAG TPA: NADP-specific glutamate dehydrogenase [Haploplasma sp.]|nr:NADP-specific glutamate dehydrogenase [Haploplasma sp.]
MNKYLNDLYLKLESKYSHQTEYLNTVKAFFQSINTYVNEHEDIARLNIVEQLIEPDRIISFKVPWVDDNGINQVNTGYRVQFSNLLGVYKGGIRFDSSVNESILKFLSLEQTLKNALTNLPLGGAKGGADFDPTNKSQAEIKRFTESFIIELNKYLGPDIDVPAGDLGVSQKTIGYMYNMSKRLTNRHNGIFTGKHTSYGGSLVRPEATGYGLCYITNSALNTLYNDSLQDKTVLVSGSGQVGINAAYKAKALGAKVIGMSSITGIIHDDQGIDIDLISTIQYNKESLKKYLETYPHAKYDTNVKNLWKIQADIIMPCATQNEIDLDDAKNILKNKVTIVAEGANKPLTNEATTYLLNNDVVIIPSKAGNAGGVATSGLEMQQNATFSKWSFEKVDNELHNIMDSIFTNIYNYSIKYNVTLTEAANVVSFQMIHEAYKNIL